MEPLLFAVKNDISNTYTYEVYQYYGTELQKSDLNMATEILMNKTEVLEDTAITDNSALVIYFAKIKPDIVLYISDDLKKDGEFVEELCKTGNKEAIMYAVQECDVSAVIQDNSDLINNPEFMKQAIKEDPSILVKADESLKNDYTFMHEVCKENKEVINYVANHTEEFGEQGLTAAKEVLVYNATSKAINEFKEELVKVQGKKEIKNTNENSIKERQLRNNTRFIERIKNGEIKQERAIRLLNSICKDLDEEFKQELMKYVKMDDAIIEKQKEEKSDIKIEPQDIEEKTITTSKLDSINKETQIIREEYTRQTKNKEVENVYRGTKEERK